MNEEERKETSAVERLVRNALEEETPLGPSLRAAILAEAERRTKTRHRRHFALVWGGSALLAASVAGVILTAVFLRPRVPCENAPADASEVEEAIVMLGELSAAASGGQAAESAGERLLDWQEAPCADLF